MQQHYLKSRNDVAGCSNATRRGRTAAALTLMLLGGTAVTETSAGPMSSWGPKWTNSGELELPNGYHTWVFLGSPLTPHALNDGKAGFPEYHNVYTQPEAYRAYRKTGQFPEGTILLKELQLTLPGTNDDGSRSEVSGRGYFPGARNGVTKFLDNLVNFSL